MAGEATEDLLDGRVDAVNRLFAQIDSPSPVVKWDPDEADLESASLRFLLRYWRERARPDALPLSSVIDALDLEPAFGYLMLLEPVEGGADFRYRLYGSTIAHYAGIEMTRKTVSDIPAPIVAAYFMATYRAVAIARRPMFAHHETRYDIQIARWDRLILPFVDAQDRVDRLLVGNIPTIRG